MPLRIVLYGVAPRAVLLILIAAIVRTAHSPAQGQQQYEATIDTDGVRVVPLVLSLEDVWFGRTVTADIETPTRCSTCGGQGYSTDPQGMQWVCKQCAGTGQQFRKVQAKITIPRGTEASSINVPVGNGENLRVDISISPHKIFQSSSDMKHDLVTKMMLTEEQAQGGFVHVLQLLDGSTLKLVHPGPTVASEIVVIPGLGLPFDCHKSICRFGSLVASFNHVDSADIFNSAQPMASWLTSLSSNAQIRFLGADVDQMGAQLTGSTADDKLGRDGGSFVFDSGRCFQEKAQIVSWDARFSAHSHVSHSSSQRNSLGKIVLVDGQPVSSAPGLSGLGLRLLLLRPMVGEQQRYTCIAESAGVEYTPPVDGSSERQFTVLDPPLHAEAGDCIGLLSDPGGVSTANWLPPRELSEVERHQTGAGAYSCPHIAAMDGRKGTTPLHAKFGGALQQGSQFVLSACQKLSRQYQMRVGYLPWQPDSS